MKTSPPPPAASTSCPLRQRLSRFSDSHLCTVAYVALALERADQWDDIPKPPAPTPGNAVALLESPLISDMVIATDASAQVSFKVTRIYADLMHDVDYFHCFPGEDFVEAFALDEPAKRGSRRLTMIYASDDMAIRLELHDQSHAEVTAMAGDPEQVSEAVARWQQDAVKRLAEQAVHLLQALPRPFCWDAIEMASDQLSRAPTHVISSRTPA